MVYSPIMPNMKLSAEDMGAPSYQDALQNVFKNAQGAAETAYKPKSLAESLLKMHLDNKINAPKAADAEGWYNTEKNYKQALIDQARAPKQLSGETAQLFQLRSQYAPGTDEYNTINNIIQRKAAGPAGTTVFDQVTGNPLVQIGGAAGSKSPAGGTFLNPQNGELTSIPTTAQTSNLQGRVEGLETAKPFIKRIIDTMPQFQDPGTKVSLLGQKISNSLFGSDWDLPSQEASGKAAMKEASEGLVKGFGLNPTGGNRKAMERILAPHPGESKRGYENRVNQQLSSYIQNQNVAKKALSSGINVSSPNNDANPQQNANKNPVPSGMVRVYFPDGPHTIPKNLLEKAIESGATMSQELPNE